ncbi:MAG: non-canonical purine NTP pyrophosphatase, partial [Clostridia bacterium]|nr:non-canonical purine NTP pyrophosphatase [Clostridia bacterium]
MNKPDEKTAKRLSSMEKNMEIVLASRNKNKIKELETLLAELCGDKVKVLSLDDIGYEGDIEEDGESYEENAVIKASVPASLGYIGVSDDSGLSVDCLDGAPGIYSA